MPPQSDLLLEDAPLYHAMELDCPVGLCGDDSDVSDLSTPPPRTIRFSAELERVHEIPARSDFSPEERNAVWLTHQDLRIMGERLRIDLMRASMKHRHGCGTGNKTGDTNPWRGLEWKTRHGAELRASNHKKGVGVVLEEQRKQRSNRARLQKQQKPHDNGSDEDRIARLYRAAIGDCQILAREIAIQDERETACSSEEMVAPSSATSPKARAPNPFLLHHQQ